MEPNYQVLSYSDIVGGTRTGGRRNVDVPVGHAISLTMPTKRFGMPAYATFASPAVRKTEHDVVQGPPDRWWLLEEKRGSLVLFALCSIYHFAETQFGTVTLPQPSETIAEIRHHTEDIRSQINAVAEAFFRGEQCESEAGARLLAALKARIPNVLWSQHEAIAPDFLTWLK